MAFSCVLHMKRTKECRKGVLRQSRTAMARGVYRQKKHRNMQITNDVGIYISSVVEKYSDMVFRTAYHALCDRHYAEDITQEVFLKLMRLLPDFDSDEHEKAWLLKVTLNMCKTYNRKTYSHPTAELTENIVSRERFGQGPVTEAVMELPEKYRTVIYLHYFEGYKVAEIAEMLGKNPNTVSSLLMRARERLKNMLEGEFDDENK